MLMTRKLEGKMILETLNSTLIPLDYISQQLAIRIRISRSLKLYRSWRQNSGVHSKI